MSRRASRRNSLGRWAAMLALPALPVLSVSGHASAAMPECPIEVVGVRYEVTISAAGADHTKQRMLWRTGSSLLQVQMQEEVAELWERTRNGGVHLVRYFDSDQRAIEYQPDDLSYRSDAPFQERMALLNALCDSNELVRETQTENGDTRVTVWRRLEVIADAQVVAAAFHDRARYPSTDYADIGDNESDPFLLRMINLGFVEHGSSGFYDAGGHSMDLEQDAEHAH